MSRSIICFVSSLASITFACGPDFLPPADAPAYEIELFDAHAELSDQFFWFHPYLAAVPGEDGAPSVFLLTQKHLNRDDHYSETYLLRSNDLGKSWTGPKPIPELKWMTEDSYDLAVSSIVPMYHAASGKLIAIGHSNLHDRPSGFVDKRGATWIFYTVYDPETKTWSEWKTVGERGKTHYAAASGCSQWMIEDDGTLLVPSYVQSDKGEPFQITVWKCRFDGDEIHVVEQGNELDNPAGRGLHEPSLTKFGNRYWLTIRSDDNSYVSTSDDGLQFTEPKPWMFDDGQPLGSYNTQAHWVTHSDGLFLVYTRRGADNEDVFRHRAPLFMAQVDPDQQAIVRETERVVVPNRGVPLGNFGAAVVTPDETWISVGENMWPYDGKLNTARGAKGAILIARIKWREPNQLAHRDVDDDTLGFAGETLALAAAADEDDVPYEWIQVNPKADFAPRDGAGALVYKDKMWFLGGWNPSDKKHFPLICNNEVWSSPDGKDWTLVKPNTFLDKSFDPKSDWEGRHTAGYVVYDDAMWIIGGDVNQGHYQNDVWKSTDGKNWELVTFDVPWAPRALHYTLVHDGKIWVMGGQTMPAFGGGEEKFYRDVWTTTDGKNWKKVEPKEPYWSARGMIGGNVVFKDRMWFLGGGTYDTPTTPTRNFYNDVWSSADGVTWKQHAKETPWEPRQYHEVAVFDDNMWVLEGYAKRNVNDVWYSPDGVNWKEVPNTPWKPRHAASVYVFDNGLWMVAGNNMESDVWKLVRKE